MAVFGLSHELGVPVPEILTWPDTLFTYWLAYFKLKAREDGNGD